MGADRSHLKRITAIVCLAGWFIITLSGCGAENDARTPDGRLILNYWEKWTGFEGDAMQAVVDEFNKSQDKLFVRYVPVSAIDRKMLVATAGGDPPDIAGVWSWIVNVYSDKNAIMPLDDLAREAGIGADHYIPFFYNLCTHRGRLWALPTTPATVALHWNRRLFKDAGLDPNRAPRTIAEIDDFAEQMTKYRLADGRVVTYSELSAMPDRETLLASATILQLGFLPFEPGWWNWAWGYWFGGALWNGSDKITADSPENIRAMTWIQSYPKKYGRDALNRFTSGFGGFASSQNAFLSGKVAMEVQGVWMYNFIAKYAPELDWAAVAFPAVDTAGDPVTVGECDVLVIPAGARHPRESFEFIKFASSQRGMELLCLGHRKFSPLASVSDDFYKKHPHPYLSVFRDMAKSSRCITTPLTSVWNEYTREFGVMFDKVRLEEATPEEALRSLQERMQKSLDRERARLRRRGKVS